MKDREEGRMNNGRREKKDLEGSVEKVPIIDVFKESEDFCSALIVFIEPKKCRQIDD